MTSKDLIAQSGASERPRPAGRYAVVGGATTGSYANTLYILDSANRELIALTWNESRKELEGVGFRDLVMDLTKEADR